MDIAHPIPAVVKSLSFTFLSTDDVRRLSVKQIVNPVLLDDLNRPTLGGLYDPALGPSSKGDICATCRLTYFKCPGHFGHIELPSAVYHPLFMTNMYNLFRTTCLYCHKFKARRVAVTQCGAKLRLLERGLLEAALSVDDIKPMVRPAPRNDAMEDTDEDDAPLPVQEQESDVEYMNRINLFVMLHLRNARGAKRDDYKDGLVYRARKAVIEHFLRSAVVRSCASCGAFAHTFRKEGFTKIIQYDLTKKQQAYNAAMGIRQGDVHLSQPRLASEIAASNGRTAAPIPQNPDVQMRGAESRSPNEEQSEEDDDDDEEGDNAPLPRAANGKVKTSRGRNERLLSPAEVRAHLRLLFAKESVLCSLLFGRHGPYACLDAKTGLSKASADMFFLSVLPVPPTRFRPPAKMAETLFEHPQNELLARVLQTSYRIRDLNVELRQLTAKGNQQPTEEKDKVFSALLERLIQLQVDVNSFLDSSKNPQPVRAGKQPPEGVKQKLEKKEGLFRMNMMGKRVNYAARSVISPDVNIETSEIGIPPVFARKLTFAEPVTSHNVQEMRQLVINGARVYPGATMVEYEDGSKQALDKLSPEQRTAIANQLLTPLEGRFASSHSTMLKPHSSAINKKVYRHLRDGDILLLNRQPTLHKPSMMAHRAKVLKGEKTIRMHYANCESYNADFDGDEMNIHFPQNHIARAEAMSIANTDNQYLVPKTGEPLRGLIQDHCVAAMRMTTQSTMFTREEYQQLIYGALRPENGYSGDWTILTVPPAIWKPVPLWTGKQIITTILKNITPSNAQGLNLKSKAKIRSDLWRAGSEEGVVLIDDGELMTGVIDKAQVGGSSYGIVHSVYELYGADVAGKLLSIFGRLFTKFLQHRAFTCRMDDLLLSPAGEQARRKLMDESQSLGLKAAISNFPDLKELEPADAAQEVTSRLQAILRNDEKMAGLDMTYRAELKTLTENIEQACLPHGLARTFPSNHMQSMIMTGAKGKPVNARQISSSLGQQDLEGRRPPVMVSGKTLPSFKPFETAASAGGYVASRFLTGLRPQEFYFHCMAGREGLIDTAVKTSRSGYLQRCLIKHLEGARIHYDHSVRAADSSVLQFQYGGDALDVVRQAHLTQFEFAVQNMQSMINRYRPRTVMELLDMKTAPAYMKKALKRPEKYFPALSVYSPSRYLGSTSEAFARDVQQYIDRNPHGLLQSKRSSDGKAAALSERSIKDLTKPAQFRSLMQVKYLRSLADPGEAVGLLAAQCIGEPSTQMTLNTFHFAGHGAANVTLGIPRLREIVMTASVTPKTPTMTIPLRAPDLPAEQLERRAQGFCKMVSRVTLADLVRQVTVRERLVTVRHPGNVTRHKTYTITLDFFPKDEYKEEHNVLPQQLLLALTYSFSHQLKKEIGIELKKLRADLQGQAKGIGKGRAEPRAGRSGEDGDGEDDEPRSRRRDDESDQGDGDAEDEKRTQRMRQQATYDDERSDQSDDEGEFDEKAIEAEFADEEDEEDDAEGSAVDQDELMQDAALDAQTEEAREIFLRVVTQASTFEFKKGVLCEFDLQFSLLTPKLLLVGLIERCCAKSVVREIPGLSSCFVLTDDRAKKNLQSVATEAGSSVELSQTQLMTNGCNFPALWAVADETTDLDNIYSNDINAILTHYGVEMARFAIIQEIKTVFETYGIEVSFRHLRLIADYMTFEGGYKPFNRQGISTSSSPLLKASYETTAAFLSDATLYGDFDDLTSPSGTIVMGKPSHVGTGGFDIVAPLF